MTLVRLFAALTYFTRIPAPTGSHEKPPKGSACYAPLIGWLVGTIAAVIYIVADVFLPSTVAMLMSMIGTIWLTRGLHEDGLADFCDGFGGSLERNRTFEIMRDSNVGVYAVLGLVSVLSVKFSSLIELVSAQAFTHSLWAIYLVFTSAHALSRLAAVSMMMTADYVSDVGTTKAGSMSHRMSKGDIVVAVIGGLLPLVFLAVVLGSGVLVAVAMVAVVRIVLARQILDRLGGYTGDCMGAIQQMTEISFYLGLLVML